MRDQDRRLWPFQPSTAFPISILILVVLLLGVAFTKSTYSWPTQEIENTVFLGVVILGLVPILLRIVDTFVERGAVVQYKDLTIDFSLVQRTAASGITIPANIGVAGQPVGDSSTIQILDALRNAETSNIAIIDLEEGQAWWETRLLALLSGAVRYSRPNIFVFVGKDGGVERIFQGWGYADHLLSLLLRVRPEYLLTYHAALAAARQWDLVEAQGPNIRPPQPVWMQPPGQGPGLSGRNPWVEAFEYDTGLPNRFYAEQLIASELGNKIEKVETPKTITLVRLEELFRPVLHKAVLDEAWSSERQLSEFFSNDLKYMALTRNGQFKSLVLRMDVLNAMVGALVQNK